MAGFKPDIESCGAHSRPGSPFKSVDVDLQVNGEPARCTKVLVDARRHTFFFRLSRELRAKDVISIGLLLDAQRAISCTYMTMTVPEIFEPQDGDTAITGKVNPAFAILRIQVIDGKGGAETLEAEVVDGSFKKETTQLRTNQKVRTQVVEGTHSGPWSKGLQVRTRPVDSVLFINDIVTAGAKSVRVGLPEYKASETPVRLAVEVARGGQRVTKYYDVTSEDRKKRVAVVTFIPRRNRAPRSKSGRSLTATRGPAFQSVRCSSLV